MERQTNKHMELYIYSKFHLCPILLYVFIYLFDKRVVCTTEKSSQKPLYILRRMRIC